jgi:hypothetical protein
MFGHGMVIPSHKKVVYGFMIIHVTCDAVYRGMFLMCSVMVFFVVDLRL